MPTTESFRYNKTGDRRSKVTFELSQREADARRLYVSKSAIRIAGLDLPNTSNNLNRGTSPGANDQFQIPHTKETAA